MKALVCSKLGNPLTSDGLQLSIDEPIPFPRLSSWTVRIHVIAGSLNFADVLVVQASASHIAKRELHLWPAQLVCAMELLVPTCTGMMFALTKARLKPLCLRAIEENHKFQRVVPVWLWVQAIPVEDYKGLVSSSFI